MIIKMGPTTLINEWPHTFIYATSPHPQRVMVFNLGTTALNDLQFPAFLYDLNKIFILVDGLTDARIVVQEFFFRHLHRREKTSVRRFSTEHTRMVIPGLKSKPVDTC